MKQAKIQREMLRGLGITLEGDKSRSQYAIWLAPKEYIIKSHQGHRTDWQDSITLNHKGSCVASVHEKP